VINSFGAAKGRRPECAEGGEDEEHSQARKEEGSGFTVRVFSFVDDFDAHTPLPPSRPMFLLL
jgi:hypothetical protein